MLLTFGSTNERTSSKAWEEGLLEVNKELKYLFRMQAIPLSSDCHTPESERSFLNELWHLRFEAKVWKNLVSRSPCLSQLERSLCFQWISYWIDNLSISASNSKIHIKFASYPLEWFRRFKVLRNLEICFPKLLKREPAHLLILFWQDESLVGTSKFCSSDCQYCLRNGEKSSVSNHLCSN